jgi:FtsH-binding integral membrane protein
VSEIFKLFRVRDYNLTVWGYVAYTFAMGAFALWGPSFLHRIHHIPEKEAGIFFGKVLVIAGLLGTLIGGYAATAWHKRNPAGYALTLGLSVLAAVPTAFFALWVTQTQLAMGLLALTMLLLFLSTGPVNTLIIETVPVHLRSSAMALSIFMIHLFGDMWSPEIVGRLSDRWHSLQKAVLILPLALAVCAVLWLILARYMARPKLVEPTPAVAR